MTNCCSYHKRIADCALLGFWLLKDVIALAFLGGLSVSYLILCSFSRLLCYRHGDFARNRP